MNIPRVVDAPVIDGLMTPGEWDAAARFDDLHQVTPVEFDAPLYRTEVFVMYTPEALYVAVYNYDDEPEKLINRVLQHDASQRDDDHVFLLLDPINTRRSGYLFVTNPNGARHDALYTSATDESFDWNGIWKAGARIVADGWIAEYEIPFKTLNIDPDVTEWGMNIHRFDLRSQTTMAWSSRNGQVNISTAGTISGLANIEQGIGLDVIPSASATTIDRRNAADDSTFDPSLDVAYKITPQLNAILTLNTDFAATEVDSIQLDTGRFSPRFPERRTFFLSDEDVFEFGAGDASSPPSPGGTGFDSGPAGDPGPDPFFSRRIGLSPDGDLVDLLGGIKLSGKAAGFGVGALAIRQDAFADVGKSDLFVTRLERGLFGESEAGVTVTHGDPTSDADSSTLAADFLYRNTRLPGNRSLSTLFWLQQTDNDGVSGDNLAWNAGIVMPSVDSWYASARVQEIQENFDPRLGFNNRNGVRQYALGLGKYWVPRDSWLQKINTEFRAVQYDYLDTGTVQSRVIDWDIINFSTDGGDIFGLDTIVEKQVLRPGERAPLEDLGITIAPGEYDFSVVSAFIETAQYRRWNFQLIYRTGEFYDGDTWWLRYQFGWRPNEHLSFEVSAEIQEFDMPEGKVYTRVHEFTNRISFTSDLSLVNLIQYDNVSEVVVFNSRLRWNIEAGKDIWFVLGHALEDADRDNRFRALETSAAAKIRYTFRF